jgi:hypothetical protein
MGRNAHVVTRGAADQAALGWRVRFRRDEDERLRWAAGLLVLAALLFGFAFLLGVGASGTLSSGRPGPGGYHPESRATGGPTQADLARSDWTDYSARRP